MTSKQLRGYKLAVARSEARERSISDQVLFFGFQLLASTCHFPFLIPHTRLRLSVRRRSS
jgi:hypothetical protein